MTWRRVTIGTLFGLIVLLGFQSLTPLVTPASLPGLDGLADAALLPNLGSWNFSAASPAGIPSMAELAGRLFRATPLRAMACFIRPSTVSVATVIGRPASAPTVEAEPAPLSVFWSRPPAPALNPPQRLPSAPSPSTPVDGMAPSATVPKVVGCFNYTICPGDDFNRLAARFGTTAEAIATASSLPVSQVLYVGMSLRIPTTDAAKVEPQPTAVAIPWSEVNGMWAVGTVAQVTDVWTGRMFYVMRRGGWAHADVEPASRADTAILRDNYGGEWSWSRRPVVVVINGRRIAASQHGMPHGDSTLDNGFPGHFCIHFLGSTTHGSSYTSNGVPTLDPAHQRCVQEAIGH